MPKRDSGIHEVRIAFDENMECWEVKVGSLAFVRSYDSLSKAIEHIDDEVAEALSRKRQNEED